MLVALKVTCQATLVGLRVTCQATLVGLKGTCRGELALARRAQGQAN